MHSNIDFQQVYRELKEKGSTDIPGAVIPHPPSTSEWRDLFHFDIDFDAMKKAVQIEVEGLKSILKDDFVKYEHVGSTAIKKMPGIKVPDIIIFVRTFPVTNEQFQALTQRGYVFRGLSPHVAYKGDDLFFSKIFFDPKEHPVVRGFALHVVPENSKELDLLINFRDLANSNKKVFELYYNNKMDKYNNKDIKSMMEYKRAKAEGLFKVIQENDELMKTINFNKETIDHLHSKKENH